MCVKKLYEIDNGSILASLQNGALSFSQLSTQTQISFSSFKSETDVSYLDRDYHKLFWENIEAQHHYFGLSRS